MKKAIIIGGGPAGLTAAHELLARTGIMPVVLECSGSLGGLSRTIDHNGNRIDIGGHRFFSKSSRVMAWWLNIIPLEDAERPADSNDVMLVRSRSSRIYYLKQFFNYPVALTADTLSKLGFVRAARIFFSYAKARMLPIKNERSLEDFFINRFGFELYNTFFKDYTEKVWGMPCSSISAEMGMQRVKGLTISKAMWHAIRGLLNLHDKDITQKQTETSLIEKFLYPKYGPGQMWEAVAANISSGGGTILMNREVKGIRVEDMRVVSVTVRNTLDNTEEAYSGDYFFSSMPMRELVHGMGDAVPTHLHAAAGNLQYRDFITVGLLVKKMLVKQDDHAAAGPENTIKDNWIYIQERDVKLGRLQIFNNWSPYMVEDPGLIWLGLEYFCNEGDDLWVKPDQEMCAFAIAELEKIRMVDKNDVLDSVVIHVDKAYPLHNNDHEGFLELRRFLDNIDNLYPVGRNGMHKYNNADHSMLTAMVAVDNIVAGRQDKSNIWDVNTEQEYHETAPND